MTVPAILFGFLASSLIGAGFHLVKGGNPGYLILYLVLAWSGFWVGHIFASGQGWAFLNLGPLQLGAGLAGSIVFLLIGRWLSRPGQEEKRKY